MRPKRPPQIAPNGQIFDPSASPIPPANKRPATQLEKHQTEKLNFLFIVQKSTKTADVEINRSRGNSRKIWNGYLLLTVEKSWMVIGRMHWLVRFFWISRNRTACENIIQRILPWQHMWWRSRSEQLVRWTDFEPCCARSESEGAKSAWFWNFPAL